MDYSELRQCRSGALCRAATVPRPDIRARLARIASRMNALCGSHVYLIDELVRAPKDWQQTTVLKSASPPHPWKALGRSDEVEKDMRTRGEWYIVVL